MKNLLLIIIALTSISVKGQSLIGIKGGLNLTDISSDIFTENSSRTGFSGGLTYEHFLTNKISIGADFVYNQRGYNSKIFYRDPMNNPLGTGTIESNYDYLSLPIKAGVIFGGKIYGFGNIGLVPSIIVNAKTKIPGFKYNGYEYNGETIDFTDSVNKFDLAGLLEIGINYKLKDKYWLFCSLAYQYSFTTITNADYFAGDKMKHYGLTMSLGVKYKLTKA